MYIELWLLQMFPRIAMNACFLYVHLKLIHFCTKCDIKLLHFRAIVGEVPGTEATVKGLVEGKPYEFRVAAVNDAGPGEFAETSKPIKPAPPPSM